MPVIVDASALDWIKPGSTPLNSRRVLTPHPGEAARLLGTKPSAIQENRVSALREISGKFGNCWVVLKGHQTLIGRNSGELFINSSGDPYLAQGGSGDVLCAKAVARSVRTPTNTRVSRNSRIDKLKKSPNADYAAEHHREQMLIPLILAA